jgi:hypothetical protein
MPEVGGLRFAIVAGTKKIRGKAIVLPKWWLDEVNARFAALKHEKRITAVSLAVDLSRAVSRELDWDHKAVERFLKGEVTTIEMMWAFLKVWPSLVQPVFVAHTKRDAERITDELRRGEPTPEWRNRYMELEAKLIEIAAPVRDHTDGVTSFNEGQDAARKPRSRRPGRVD